MIKLKNNLIFTALLLIGISYPRQIEVIFRITTVDTLDADEYIYITGNHSFIGDWQPDATRLTRKSPNLWKIKLEFSSPVNLEYKFTRGSWETKEVQNDDTTQV